jgi:predicted RNase H-like HicB family nuclease
MTFTIETEQEQDGRWIAEIVEIPGALVYGTTQEEAVAHVKALTLRVLADRLEKREADSDFSSVTFGAA